MDLYINLGDIDWNKPLVWLDIDSSKVWDIIKIAENVYGESNALSDRAVMLCRGRFYDGTQLPNDESDRKWLRTVTESGCIGVGKKRTVYNYISGAKALKKLGVEIENPKEIKELGEF